MVMQLDMLDIKSNFGTKGMKAQAHRDDSVLYVSVALFIELYLFRILDLIYTFNAILDFLIFNLARSLHIF